jgi:ion channel-forming bestrophin family protein
MKKVIQFLQYVVPGGKTFWYCMLVVLVYSLSVQYTDDHGFPTRKLLDADAALMTSVVMGVLLVFRTNSAYDRWWEARKIWGQLVNDMRNLAIKSHEFASPTGEEALSFARLIQSFPYALKDHLRGYAGEVAPYREFVQDSANVPMDIARLIYMQLNAWRKQNTIDGFEMLQIDRHARSLMDALGASERILKSPIAGSYKFLIWTGLSSYFAFLPWLLVPTLDNWSVYAVMMSAYFVVALELLAEEVERPFGDDANDLPLDAICNTIEKSVMDVFSNPTAKTQELAERHWS